MVPRFAVGSPLRWLSTAAVGGWLIFASLWTSPLAAQEIRFSTENDIFLHNPTPDDLYTFNVALEVERGPYRVALHENAFTDRAAGTRFDETHLAVGRALPYGGPWSLYAEAGAVRVGRGLFGEGTQNAVHRLLGGDEVALSYRQASLHPRFAAAGERWFRTGYDFELGPRLEAQAVPGLRSHWLIAGQGRWRPAGALALDLLLGARFDEVSLSALVPHIPKQGAVARLAVILAESVVASWTYNEYGDEREHIGLSYRLPLARRVNAR